MGVIADITSVVGDGGKVLAVGCARRLGWRCRRCRRGACGRSESQESRSPLLLEGDPEPKAPQRLPVVCTAVLKIGENRMNNVKSLEAWRCV